jgi:hypothetical protein
MLSAISYLAFQNIYEKKRNRFYCFPIFINLLRLHARAEDYLHPASV